MRSPSRTLSRRILHVAIAATLIGGALSDVRAQTTDWSRIGQPASAGNASTAPGQGATGWIMTPGLTLGAGYDSNVYATAATPRGDTILTLAPSLSVRRQDADHGITLSASAARSQYRHFPSENSTDYALDASGRQRINPRGDVFGGLGLSRAHEDRTSPDDVLGKRPTTFTDRHAHLGVTQRWPSLSLTFGTTYDHLEFGNVTSASGSLIDNADRSRNVVGAGFRLGYRIAGHLDVFAQGTYDERRYLRKIDDNGYRRDSRGDSWVIGLASRDSTTLRGELYAGWLSQRYADPRLPTVSVPTVGAAVSWRLSPQTTIDASIDRSVQETTLPGASSYLDTTFGLHATRQLTGRLSARAGIDATRSDFRGLGRRDDLYAASFGLSYRLQQRWAIDASYQLLQRHSGVADAEYYRNEIYLGLRMDTGPRAAGGEALVPTDSGSAEGSGFYLGVSAGHGNVDTRVTGLRGEHGTYRGDFAGRGMVRSAFVGYAARLGNWSLGLEASVAPSSVDWVHDKTPTSRIFSTDQRRDTTLAVLAGPMLTGNGWLFASAGRTRSRFDSAYAVEGGTASAQSDTRWSNSYGVGLDVPLSGHLFARTRYDVAHYGGYDVANASGSDRFADSSGQFQFALGWRMGAVPDDSRAERRVGGFYAGAQGGDHRFGSTLDAVQRQSEVPTVSDFHADFGGRGTDFGAFAGYGHAFGPLYAGVEIEADASDSGWYHEKQPGGREFSVEGRASYGATLRLGYATRYGALVYLRAGQARARFHTTYIKGESSSAWVDRSDTRHGDRFGIGIETPLWKSAFLRMDYSATRYGAIAFTTTQAKADDLRFANWQYLARIGIGVRF
ncbi:MAG: outer membrane beta-barrel protein [Xanthomonadaceae bacterium]|nr:outer membrane beta-barrel protein [Xanthomonadaceae bacterium]